MRSRITGIAVLVAVLMVPAFVCAQSSDTNTVTAAPLVAAPAPAVPASQAPAAAVPGAAPVYTANAPAVANPAAVPNSVPSGAPNGARWYYLPAGWYLLVPPAPSVAATGTAATGRSVAYSVYSSPTYAAPPAVPVAPPVPPRVIPRRSVGPLYGSTVDGPDTGNNSTSGSLGSMR
jgi:hypothetical protein